MRSLIILLLTTVSAAATECHSSVPPAPREHWAWRMIDGRQCWYIGERGRDKSLLHWPQPKPAAAKSIAPSEPEPDPPIKPSDALPGIGFDDRWDPVGELKVYRPK